MTQSTPPPAIQYGNPPGRPRTSAAAIISLVCGILGCIPIISGLLAILFGFIGIKKTSNPSVGGRGLAIAGLILGIVSIVGWSGFGSLLGYAYLESRPAAAVAQQFLQDVCAGNIAAAQNNSTGFTAAQLQTESDRLKTYGTFQSLSTNSFNLSDFNGVSVMHLGGMANFSNGPQTYKFDLTKTAGTYKVTSFSIP